MKESTVSSTTLKLHADTIFSMYQKPIMVSSKEWKALQRQNLLLHAWSIVQFLHETNAKMKENHERGAPVRSTDST